ncbi:alkaline phosphatase family protein [Desulfolutivibrio sulfoxidireducens]|uniref:alkaline phosphatase family protein n=1 Tax=Desulfolutivibrio sulfoxidireducens TaxID=2773299 RepID=UPI00159D1D64|nr:alkaline phosphatase family protein [Desulfolutivibrio sulfoxidireducens]QLA15693.1 2,3-bisphosphoglycerate-independent phosphoglycerate mutase [Desulfolutivibrio sulfoxidireducens]
MEHGRVPRRCVLVVLDGLGDRAYARFGHKTPLAAAKTPHLDRLAALGCNGLYHAGILGQPLPSENAHFAMFGYEPCEFPGRGPLEALGAGIPVAPDEVAALAHLCSVRERDGCLYMFCDKPARVSDDEGRALFAAVAEFESRGVRFRLVRYKGCFGILALAGPPELVGTLFTDTNPMVDDLPIPEVLPLRGADAASVNTAAAVKDYLLHANAVLSGHPVNRERERRGLDPVNALVTQRPGRLAPIESFTERHGLRGLTIASGIICPGLGRYLGMDVHLCRDTDDPGADLAARLAVARTALADHDFIHVHTKAPDEAAHTKSPEKKLAVIEALDRGIGQAIGPILDDENVILAVTADHSTPSAGPLIHSGEPVPLVVCGQGARRDAVASFDEISAAGGALGHPRGTELLRVLLNAMDRARLEGIRETPVVREFWPSPCRPFRLRGS